MSVKEILSATEHRPWPLPSIKWSYYQEWNDAIFLHWRVDATLIKEYIPKELELDLIDGSAWVSLVAFTMERIRPRVLPSFSPISNFHEINIRTYVTRGAKSGVYFLNIEAGKRISCYVAKMLSELPYRYSNMKRISNRFTSNQVSTGSSFKLEYELGGKILQITQLDRWLTERYALFQDSKQYLNQFEIHHTEWLLKEITVHSLLLNYPKFPDLFHERPDLCHYSPGVSVLAWGKESQKCG